MALLRRALLTCASLLLILSALFAAPPGAHATPAGFGECSASFYLGDPRLGPMMLPRTGPVGEDLRGYHRTGRQSAARLLATFYDPLANDWRHPPFDGFAIGSNGGPIRWNEHLMPGKVIDRYGSEFGTSLAPDRVPYRHRSLPPSSLVGTPAQACNYHEYVVAKNFTVHAGPAASWFFQPGGGLRYKLSAELVPGAPANLNVMWLVDNGYLQRLR